MKKKIRSKAFSKNYSLWLWGGLFMIIGGATLMIIRAAVPLTIDTSLPVPQNVRTYSDDRNMTVTWDPVGVNQTRVIGYYITYRTKGSSEEFKVRQTEVRRDQYYEYAPAIQLQPLTNGQEYEVYVQSASGTFVNVDAGPLVYDGTNKWGKADGKVSNKSAVAYGTPSSARVDAMRTRLTGFFDDFNTVAGPMDELKWNNSTNSCAKAGTASAFINDQFHAHNTVGSNAAGSVFCDRAGIASRPRAVFDMTNVTESNPGQIEFDIDGATHHRDTWYLDLVPLSARTNKLPLDITSHNDLFDADTENPGNMLRFNGNSGSLTVPYYNNSQDPNPVNLFRGSSACQDWHGGFKVDYDSCDMSQKTSGLSSLAEPTISPDPIPNVRRHWVIQFTPTKIRVFIDSTLIAVADMPTGLFAEKKFTVQSTVFSYNTGKTDGFDPGPIPTVEMIHWDNFGFNGPSTPEVVHNYMEGGATGTNPVYANGDSSGYSVPSGSRKTIVPIPDTIGNLVNNQARLFYSTTGFSYNYGYWTPGDHILVNGKRYDVPNPNTQMSIVSDPLGSNFMVTAFTLPIAKSDLVTGPNNVEFKFADPDLSFVNVHIELPYSSSDSSRPSYTQPLTIFGTKFYDIAQPPITNCDQYRYVEQDLGLPYQTGKANLVTGGECVLLPKGSHHNTGTTPPPTTDTAAPTVSLLTPTAGATVNGSVSVSASATDAVGVVKVEFLVDGVLKTTDSTSPYTYNWDSSSSADGTRTLTAKAYDAAGNSNTSSIAVTVKNAVAVKAGDVNSDNKVDIFDLSILLGNYSKTSTTRSQGDLNADSKIDIFDLSILLGAWGS
ncbi:MAG: Ig-like domain-containing protein [Candidatus Saccharibacteria bacterium]|nr:Ig-like domain-containing protein [Candidatus Saccharibacteria bacterium]